MTLLPTAIVFLIGMVSAESVIGASGAILR